jgi:hypothetical protein
MQWKFEYYDYISMLLNLNVVADVINIIIILFLYY